MVKEAVRTGGHDVEHVKVCLDNRWESIRYIKQNDDLFHEGLVSYNELALFLLGILSVVRPFDGLSRNKKNGKAVKIV